MSSTHGPGPRSQTPGENQRRTPRVSARIPLHLSIGHDRVPATTLAINRHGGLILSPVAVRGHGRLWIQNQHSAVWAQVRVVRVYSEGLTGGYELAVEFLDNGTCWAEEYQKASGSASG